VPKAKTRRARGTGHVFRPTYRAADGSLREQHLWWLSYRSDGVTIREPAETEVKTEAEAKLRARIAAVDAGTLTSESRKTTLAGLRKCVEDDYTNNGRRSLKRVQRAFTILEEHFGADCKASSIDANAIEKYKAKRLETAKAATVNWELASLRRGFHLAHRFGKVATRPDFSILALNNARRGFFDQAQFTSLLKHVPEWLAPLLTFLYLTGWRSAEAKRLEWRNVDRKARVIRIEDTKNDEPRTIPYGALPQLVQIIEGQWRRTEKAKKAGVVCPFVFHENGAQVGNVYELWHEACRLAGVPGRVPHDFRRSAARNMLRAGIPQAVAMQIGGWKTDSVFRRYAIVDENLLAENMAKLAALR
jgi:integrase